MRHVTRGYTVIMRDFNLHIEQNKLAVIRWNHVHGMCANDFLNQYVEASSRGERAILDLFLCNENKLIVSPMVKRPLGKINHNMK